jgi:hypothetical protein
MKTAWLVTWAWIGAHAARDPAVVAIFNYRHSPETVRDFIERYYVSHYFSVSEKLRYAKNKHGSPYRAHVSRGRIDCGHNPHLYGRMVRNLHVEEDSHGKEVLKWEEIPVAKNELESPLTDL